jgi:hypothetical protein
MSASARLIFGAGALLFAAACATHPKLAARTSEPSHAAPAPRRVTLATVAVERYPFPRVAEGLNTLLASTRLPGVDDYVHSKVTMEMGQLAIECVEPTSACYAALGRSLSANRLLWAQVNAEPKRKSKVHVVVTLFDVDTGEAIHVAERVFKSEEEAVRSAKDLVAEAAGETLEAGKKEAP